MSVERFSKAKPKGQGVSRVRVRILPPSARLLFVALPSPTLVFVLCCVVLCCGVYVVLRCPVLCCGVYVVKIISYYRCYCVVLSTMCCCVVLPCLALPLVPGGGARTHGRASVLSRPVELGLCILPAPSVASLDTREEMVEKCSH